MGLFDGFRRLFTSDKLDVSSRFEFLREAVSGTMSTFRAVREIGTGRMLGLKILDREKTTAFEARFTGLTKPPEGEIALSMKHPRIVVTHEYGETTDGAQYILMEFLEGSGLNTLIRNQDPVLEGKRLTLFRQMAESLAYVHEQGYVHRDICPRNYICRPDASSLKLIDFGLTVPADGQFLLPGNRTGTPLYMAPEIVRRRPTDKRVDIFALGVSAYRLFAMEFPWQTGDATGKAALAHDTHAPEDIFRHRPKLNRQLGELIMQCMAADREARPQSAESITRVLRSIRKEEE